MPNAIKKSNEEIATLLFYTRVRRHGKLSDVQRRVYEATSRAAIAELQAEMFGA